jgi:hypothetical protein
MITNQTHAQKLMDEAKFTSSEGCVCLLPKSGKPAHAHTHGDRGIVSVFIPDVGLPLALRRELGFTVFVIGKGRGLGEGIGEEQT